MEKKVFIVVDYCYWSSSGNLISESPKCVFESYSKAMEKCEYYNRYLDSDEYRTHRFYVIECKMC